MFNRMFNKWGQNAVPPPSWQKVTKQDRNCFNWGSYLN